MDEPESGTEQLTFTVAELQERLDEANRVLGPDDGKCTYDAGYRPRQAVFACLTCCEDKPAGICTSCAMTCHNTHEVVELWTKRHFRCDCGNSKFGGNECQLRPGKDEENLDNAYNQNFKGAYCYCHRPYPDPEREGGEDEDEVMTQCVVCEDWFHDEHLGQVTEGIGFEEMICPDCFATRCKFLAFYEDIFAQPVRPTPGELLESPAATGTSGADETITSQVTQDSTANNEDGALVGASLRGLPQGHGFELSAENGGEAEFCTLAAKLHGKALSDAVTSLTMADLRAAVPALAEADEVNRDGLTLPGPQGIHASSVIDNVAVPIIPEKPPSASVLPDATSPASVPPVVTSPAGASPVGVDGKSATAKEPTASLGTTADAGGHTFTLSPAKPVPEGESGGGSPLADVEGKSGGSPKEPKDFAPAAPPLFLVGGWRSTLCTCGDCTSHYEQQRVAFLANESDTVDAYEEANKKKVKEMEEESSRALAQSMQQMGHVQLLEFLYATEDLKAAIRSHLSQLGPKVITEDVVRDFFEEYKRKRRRTS